MDASKVSENVIKTITQLKQSTAVFLIVAITLIIILIALLYYFYYSGLKSRQCSTMNSIYGDLNGKIRSIDNTEQFNYTLKDYYIKTAYNACSGGNYKNDYVDTCVLKDLLKQGVRGLDFEIFSINDQPIVATSTSDSYYVKETFNYVNFSDIMNIIRDYAFATSTAPNALDPIILHLRIKSTNQAMYKNFAKLLENYDSILLGKEYDSEYYGKNFGNVELRKLLGKVIIVVDRSNTTFLECPEFYKFINITSNSVFMRETGCQLLGMRYQKIDTNIEENDVFFNENGYAFVLKPEKLRYIPVTVPLPPPQNPDLAYATRTVQSDFYKFSI